MSRRDRSRIRAAFVPRVDITERPFTNGVLRIDVPAGRAAWAGRALALSRRELALLALLAAHPGVLVTDEELGAHAWNETHTSPQAVMAAVKRVRRALRDSDGAAGSLETVRGLGYRYTAVGTGTAEDLPDRRAAS